jgi:hypothetical protein
MWIVKNPLRATLSLRGLGVSIAAGDEFDLDAIGRDAAEKSPQVAVAIEEGYLKNVFKAPRDAAGGTGSQPVGLTPEQLRGLVTSEDFEKFKAQFLDELRKQLPALQKLEQLDALKKLDTLSAQPAGPINLKEELEGFRKAIAGDVRQVVTDIQVAKEKIDAERRKILSDSSLSEAEIKARLSFLEEKERELTKNFETIGRTVEANDGDVMDKADLLSGL